MNNRPASKVQMLCCSALFCALLIVSTLLLRFTLPGTNVLVTAQVFFVLLCGLVLPAKYALYAVGSYILLGLMGLPIFSMAAGPGVLFTPSAGFLLGFPCAAFAANKIKRRLCTKNKGCDFIAALLGLMVIYLVAIPYIALLHRVMSVSAQSMWAYLSACCFPFLPLDIVKSLLAAAVAPRIRRAVGI